MTFEKLVEEIKENKIFADEEITGDFPKTYLSRLGRKEAAKNRLNELYLLYKNELKGRFLSVLVTGSKAEEFTKIAVDTGNMVEANADSLYIDLTNRINPVYYSGTESSASIVENLSRHLFDKARELDVSEYNELFYKSKYAKHISSKEQMLAFTKELINAEVGSELAAADVLEQVTQKAFKSFFGGKVLPVVVLLKDSSLKDEMANGLKILGKVFTVNAEGTEKNADFNLEKTDQKSVISVLKQINNSMKVKKGEK